MKGVTRALLDFNGAGLLENPAHTGSRAACTSSGTVSKQGKRRPPEEFRCGKRGRPGGGRRRRARLLRSKHCESARGRGRASVSATQVAPTLAAVPPRGKPLEKYESLALKVAFRSSGGGIGVRGKAFAEFWQQARDGSSFGPEHHARREFRGRCSQVD